MTKLYIRTTGAVLAAFAVLALWIPALDQPHAPQTIKLHVTSNAAPVVPTPYTSRPQD